MKRYKLKPTVTTKEHIVALLKVLAIIATCAFIAFTFAN